MFWIFVFVLALFTFYVVLPFFDKNFRGKAILPGTEDKENLLFQKEELLQALNDLEYDFQMNKISEPDYYQLKNKLTSQTIELMKRLDELEGKKSHAASSDATPRKIRSAR